MIKPEPKAFIESMTNDQVVAIIEAARIAMANTNIADEIANKFNISDPDINNIQHKCHRFMEKYNGNTTVPFCAR